MVKIVALLVVGLFLAVIGSLLAAIVAGEVRKLPREAQTHPGLAKLVAACAASLVVVVACTLFLTFLVTLWFLLVLLPITFLFVGIAALNGPNDTAAGSQNRLVTRDDYLAIKARYKQP